MCKRFMLINASCKAGIRSAYIPCGHCVDCRRVQAQAWSFRINSEFLDLKKRGWNVAFCTLTYRNADLPHIPRECFVNPDEYREIPCFSRYDARKWIDDVRQYCKYHFGFKKDKESGQDNRVRYFVATELGTLKHRPHLHAILAWPSSVGYEEMHKICTEYWKFGYLFPRHPEGDRLTHCLSFEVVGDASKVLTYVSKYVCKDLELESLQSGIEFYSRKKDYAENSAQMSYYRAWRNCQSFHLQSQSLGFEAVKNLSDADKMDVYLHGMYFTTDKHARPQQLPIYLKHKLIFDPYYTYVQDEKGNVKRMVQRKASAFFMEHCHEIFDMKSKFYQKYCLQSESAQYYKDRGLGNEMSERIAGLVQSAKKKLLDYGVDYCEDCKMGRLYLAYNCVSNSYSYDIDLCSQWMLRYYPEATLSARLLSEPDCNFDYWLYDLKHYWSLIDKANSLLGHMGAPEREHDEEIIHEIQNFFNYEVKNVV